MFHAKTILSRRTRGSSRVIVTYVNQERIIKKMDDGFTRFTTVMQEDLDQPQIGGGNLSMEILQEHILHRFRTRWISWKHSSKTE